MRLYNSKNAKWVHFGTDRFNREFIRPIINTIPCKPYGGMWLSPLNPPKSPYLSEWEQFCCEKNITFKSVNKYIVVSLRSDSRIIYIDTHDDLLELSDYFVQNEFTCGDVENKYAWKCLDFERLCTEYDGIYLTSNGALECYYALYG